MNDQKQHSPHKVKIVPKMQTQLERMGERIKLARLRREYAAGVVAERAGISRATLNKVEKGDAGVAFGIYAKVLAAIGLSHEIDKIASDDELGRLLQDSKLLEKGKRKS